MRFPRSPVVLPMVLALVASHAAAQSGQHGPLRGDMLVHDGHDFDPRVAVDAEGRSIFVWSDTEEVYFRIFDATDVALSDPEQLNTTTDGDQFHPDVATHPDGSFFAVWRSDEDDGYQIRGRYYDAVSGLAASDQLVNDLGQAGSAGHSGLGVAPLDGGGFVVVWESRLGHGPDSDNGSTSIQAKLVGANGVVAGGNQFQVNDYGTSWQISPAAAPTAGGGFFVVWQSNMAPGDSSGYSVRGRHFSAAGAALSGELQISTTTAGHQWEPEVARNGNQELLAVYESGDQDETVVRARAIGSNAVPSGTDFLVTTRTDIVQYRPQVAGGPHTFFVAWQRIDVDNDVVGRLVVGPGEFDGPPFQINDYDDLSQHFPAVGANLSQARVAWKGVNDLGANTNSIIGSGFQLCLFCDDFESGDTSLWSVVF